MKSDLVKKYGNGNVERVEQLLLKDVKYDRSSRDKDEEWTVGLSHPNKFSGSHLTYTPSKALLIAARKMLGLTFDVTFHFVGHELEDVVRASR